MQTNIQDEIQGMKRIQLKQEDFIGTGSLSNVYRYRIHNVVLIVKCFQDQTKAEKENATLEEIQRVTLNYPGIIHYYGMKKLDIEIIGTFNESYNGYVMFFQKCKLDFQKMLGIITKIQTKEIFNLLSQNNNLYEFIFQIINSFNQLKPNINSYFPNFKSDILNNPLYSMIILALFEEQSIQLSRIHTQLNLQSEEFDTEKFHKDCDNKGSTLLIMHSNSEPNSFFGGMAAPSWNSDGSDIADPAGEYSWLFKIEVTENMIHLHQWKCIKVDEAIYGSESYGPIFGEGEFGGSYFGEFAKIEFYYFLIFLIFIIIIINIRQQKLNFIISQSFEFSLSQILIYKNTISLLLQFQSALHFANNNYEKINLNDKTSGLLSQLKNEINCPQKVERAIMNEEETFFYLDSCEVFAIKK